MLIFLKCSPPPHLPLKPVCIRHEEVRWTWAKCLLQLLHTGSLFSSLHLLTVPVWQRLQWGCVCASEAATLLVSLCYTLKVLLLSLPPRWTYCSVLAHSRCVDRLNKISYLDHRGSAEGKSASWSTLFTESLWVSFRIHRPCIFSSWR